MHNGKLCCVTTNLLCNREVPVMTKQLTVKLTIVFNSVDLHHVTHTHLFIKSFPENQLCEVIITMVIIQRNINDSSGFEIKFVISDSRDYEQ